VTYTTDETPATQRSLEEWQTPAYDPEKARQLLREAGYPQGFNMVLNTFPLAGAPWLGKMAEAVADYWGKVGMRTELRVKGLTFIGPALETVTLK